jgi:SAM-dependent methyltransferase
MLDREGSARRGIRERSMIEPRTVQTAAAVAEHYDELDPFYREVWGRHVHHGYWANGRESAEEAVEGLIELLAARLALAPGQQLCDVGCGYGATALHLAGRYGVEVTGVTISPVQAARAQDAAAGHDRVAVACRDWLTGSCAPAGASACWPGSPGRARRRGRSGTSSSRSAGRVGSRAWAPKESTAIWPSGPGSGSRASRI